eukprot:1213087-Pleurochrysis_carterae.AAC.1
MQTPNTESWRRVVMVTRGEVSGGEAEQLGGGGGDAKSLRHMLTDLDPHTVYSLRVIAQNSQGYAVSDQLSPFLTGRGAGALGQPPIVKALCSFAYNVSWPGTLDECRPDMSFDLQHRAADSNADGDGEGWVTSATSISAESVQVMQLRYPQGCEF